MKRAVLVVIIGILSLAMLSCGNKGGDSSETKEKLNSESNLENDEKSQIEYDEYTDEQKANLMIREFETDYGNTQPYKEYINLFPKNINPDYIPKCHSYFLGNPYADGEEVYWLQISTACYGDDMVKVQLNKARVNVKTKEDYVHTVTDENGNYVDVDEKKTTTTLDTSVTPNVTVAVDKWGELVEKNYIESYVYFVNSEKDGKTENAYVSPITKELLYAPGTSIENGRTYYSFEELYGIGTYLKIDFTKINDDIVTIDTNINTFSTVNGKEFKADWEWDKGNQDNIADPEERPLPEYNGTECNDYYPKAIFYDSLVENKASQK